MRDSGLGFPGGGCPGPDLCAARSRPGGPPPAPQAPGGSERGAGFWPLPPSGRCFLPAPGAPAGSPGSEVRVQGDGRRLGLPEMGVPMRGTLLKFWSSKGSTSSSLSLAESGATLRTCPLMAGRATEEYRGKLDLFPQTRAPSGLGLLQAKATYL